MAKWRMHEIQSVWEEGAFSVTLLLLVELSSIGIYSLWTRMIRQFGVNVISLEFGLVR